MNINKYNIKYYITDEAFEGVLHGIHKKSHSRIKERPSSASFTSGLNSLHKKILSKKFDKVLNDNTEDCKRVQLALETPKRTHTNIIKSMNNLKQINIIDRSVRRPKVNDSNSSDFFPDCSTKYYKKKQIHTTEGSIVMPRLTLTSFNQSYSRATKSSLKSSKSKIQKGILLQEKKPVSLKKQFANNYLFYEPRNEKFDQGGSPKKEASKPLVNIKNIFKRHSNSFRHFLKTKSRSFSKKYMRNLPNDFPRKMSSFTLENKDNSISQEEAENLLNSVFGQIKKAEEQEKDLNCCFTIDKEENNNEIFQTKKDRFVSFLENEISKPLKKITSKREKIKEKEIQRNITLIQNKIVQKTILQKIKLNYISMFPNAQREFSHIDPKHHFIFYRQILKRLRKRAREIKIKITKKLREMLLQKYFEISHDIKDFLFNNANNYVMGAKNRSKKSRLKGTCTFKVTRPSRGSTIRNAKVMSKAQTIQSIQKMRDSIGKSFNSLLSANKINQVNTLLAAAMTKDDNILYLQDFISRDIEYTLGNHLKRDYIFDIFLSTSQMGGKYKNMINRNYSLQGSYSMGLFKGDFLEKETKKKKNSSKFLKFVARAYGKEKCEDLYNKKLNSMTSQRENTFLSKLTFGSKTAPINIRKTNSKSKTSKVGVQTRLRKPPKNKIDNITSKFSLNILSHKHFQKKVQFSLESKKEFGETYSPSFTSPFSSHSKNLSATGRIKENLNEKMHSYVISGNIIYVRKLIKDNLDLINLNYQDLKGDTSLILSVRYGYEEIVGVLLENGANPNVSNVSIL